MEMYNNKYEEGNQRLETKNEKYIGPSENWLMNLVHQIHPVLFGDDGSCQFESPI